MNNLHRSLPAWLACYGKAIYIARITPVPAIPDYYAPTAQNRYLRVVDAALRAPDGRPKMLWPLGGVVRFIRQYGAALYGVDDVDMALMVTVVHSRSPFLLIASSGCNSTKMTHYIHANLVRSYVLNRFVADNRLIPQFVLEQFVASRRGGAVA